MSDPAALQTSAELDRFRVVGTSYRMELIGAIERGGQNDVETTIEGASTLQLTVRDTDGMLRERLRGTVRMSALGMDWELSGINKSDDSLSLTFEDRLVADLRKRDKRGKASRGKVTRAQFVRSRVIRDVRRAGGEFVCPQLNVRQPVSRAEKDKKRSKGFARGTKIKGKEGPIVISNAEDALDVAAEEGAGKKATLAMVLAGIVEGPDFKNPAGGHADSSGSFQVRAGTARDLGIDPRDVKQCARAFLRRGFYGRGGAIELARKNPGKSAGWVAQQVQGSGFALRYDQYKSAGNKLIDAYGGAGGSGKTSREHKRYAFTQGPPDGSSGENAWDMANRLAEQVGWRRFVIGARDFYFISEAELMKSRPRMVLREGSGGVDRINHDGRANTRVDQCTVTCRAELWSAPPGSVVEVEDQGIASGKWLVSSVRRGVFSLESSIELRRGRELVKALAEPAAESTSSRGSGGGSGRNSSGQMERPVSGGSVSNGFGAPRPGGRKHAGMDIAVPVGTTVKAALGGTVSLVANNPGGYGLYIDVQHANGLKTRYGHLSKQSVSKGKRVDRGQKIGESGNTGRSTGPHLHFEVHKNGVPQNPASYI